MAPAPTMPITLEGFLPTQVILWKYGFTDNHRDYQIEIYATWDNIETVRDEDRTMNRYHGILRGCVEANYQLCVPTENYPTLMDNIYTDYSRWCRAGCPKGIVWASTKGLGTGSWRYVRDSERAREWSDKTKLPMHEVEIKTRAIRLTLVFHAAEFSRPPASGSLLAKIVGKKLPRVERYGRSVGTVD